MKGDVVAGRYHLEREVGRGGMGAVWLAHDELLGREVALKRIGVLPGDTEADLDRVEREARVSAKLHHEHVVSVFDLVSEDDHHWLVMEYVESRTLADLIRKRRSMSPDEVAPILAQTATALAAAHRAGIVHRDVKPSNILVAADGRVKLGDFGIARSSGDPSLTQTGLVTGSPSYLAPEIASGRPATPASDMWSLGATLFHAVAGKPPYDARDNLLGALYQIVHEEPPTTDRAGWLSPLLGATLVHEPKERWSADRAAMFLHAGPGDSPTITVPVAPRTWTVRPAAPVPPVPPPPTDTPGRIVPWRIVGALAAAIVVLLGLAWFAGQVGDDPRPRPDRATTGGQVTEARMVGFVEDYLATVTDDPEEAWPRLTPEFQEASGGFASYRAFWDTIEDYQLSDVSADTDSMIVSYTVTYTVDDEGEREPEQVSLELQSRDGDLFIADEL